MSSPVASPRRASAKALMLAACLAIFIWGAIDALLGAILPDLIQRAHLSIALTGNIALYNGIGLVLASLVAGPALDRWGKKAILAPALLLVAAALAGLTMIASYRAIAVLVFVLGLGGSAIVTTAQALVADMHGTAPAAALNLLNFFFGLGAFTTPLARTPLAAWGGMNGILWVLAAVCALVCCWDTQLAFPFARPRLALGARPPLWGEPLFWLPVTILFLYVGIETSIWFWQVVYWTRAYSVSAAHARVGVSVFAAAIMAGRLLSQWILRVLSPGGLLLAGTAGTLVALTGMRVATNFELSLLALTVAGLFMAVVFPTALSVVGARFVAASGTPIGLAVTAGWLGAMTIRPAVGYVAERKTLGAGYWCLIGTAALMLFCDLFLTRSLAAPGAPAALEVRV